MSSETKHINKKGFWREHSEAWNSSGLTQLAYCDQQGISYRSFVYQHNRIPSKSQHAPMNFVTAKTEAVTMNRPTAELQLILPNGIRIGISNEVDPALLETVLAIAGGLSC